MSNGASAKSKPKISKVDEKELGRLRKQDYWLQVRRAKLVMDLIFVCEFSNALFGLSTQNKLIETFDFLVGDSFSLGA